MRSIYIDCHLGGLVPEGGRTGGVLYEEVVGGCSSRQQKEVPGEPRPHTPLILKFQWRSRGVAVLSGFTVRQVGGTVQLTVAISRPGERGPRESTVPGQGGLCTLHFSIIPVKIFLTLCFLSHSILSTVGFVLLEKHLLYFSMESFMATAPHRLQKHKNMGESRRGT